LLKAVEDISSTKKRLKIEIPADSIEAEIRKGLIDAQKKASFPGFRQGKAPLLLVEKKYGRDIEAEVLERMTREYYLLAVKEADIKPVARPFVEEAPEFRRNSELSMTMTVDVMPKIEALSYENITVKNVPVEITDEEVLALMKNLAEERATYESSFDPVEAGDMVTIDYVVKGEETTAKDVVLKIGSGPYPKEFFDGIIGRRKDERIEIEAVFPDDMQLPYAGKKTSFVISITEVKKQSVPALDEEFAKDIGLESLEQVREKVRENVLNAKKRKAENDMQREILDKLLGNHVFDIPESLLNHELNGILSDVRASGKEERSDEVLMEKFRPDAERSVKTSLLLQMIGEKENVNVAEEEVRNEIAAMSYRFRLTPENIIKYYVTRDGSLEGLRHSVFERKVLALLLSKANIEP